MSYEEVCNAIVAGVPAGSFEEAEEAVDVLCRANGRIPQMLAVRIAEARRFRKADTAFWKNAAERWGFRGDKTAFHYYGVGCLLLALRDYKAPEDTKEGRTLESEARKCYSRLLSLEFGKLDKLKMLLSREGGEVAVMNFMKTRYDPGWTNRQFAAAVDAAYGPGRETRPKPPVQLTFSFDLFDDVQPEQAADVLDGDGVNGAFLLQAASNGVLWARAAARRLAGRTDEFAGEAAAEFERIAAELAEAQRFVAEALEAFR